MPLGNGDIGMNVWVEENGDLLFFISKTDSWSDAGRLLKLGQGACKTETFAGHQAFPPGTATSERADRHSKRG